MLNRHKALTGYTVYTIGKPIAKATQTRLFNRKSTPKRVLETVNDSLDVSSGIKSVLASAGSGKALKAGMIAAGSLAGLTAASAGISSLRRRGEGASDDS
jgi:hypothetical protein